MREAHAYPAINPGRVKCMQRLPELQHHVVGDIHDRTDAANAAPGETLHHPARSGRPCVHAPHQAPAVTGTGTRRGKFDPQRIVKRGAHCRHFHGAEQRPGDRGNLARDPRKSQTVSAIGRGLDRDQMIIEIEHLTHVGAYRRIIRQLQQARGVFAQPQFPGGTEHPVRLHAANCCDLDLDPGELRPNERGGHPAARAHVGRAAHDGKRRHTDVHGANRQPVRARMLLHRQHFPDHDAVEGRRHGFNVLHVQSAHGERVRQFARGKRRIDEGAEPVFRKLHAQLNCLRNRRSFSKNRRRSFTP